jgi:hypothetical protein
LMVTTAFNLDIFIVLFTVSFVSWPDMWSIDILLFVSFRLQFLIDFSLHHVLYMKATTELFKKFSTSFFVKTKNLFKSRDLCFCGSVNWLPICLIDFRLISFWKD